jgi:hypothetical protein
LLFFEGTSFASRAMTFSTAPCARTPRARIAAGDDERPPWRQVFRPGGGHRVLQAVLLEKRMRRRTPVAQRVPVQRDQLDAGSLDPAFPSTHVRPRVNIHQRAARVYSALSTSPTLYRTPGTTPRSGGRRRAQVCWA